MDKPAQKKKVWNSFVAVVVPPGLNEPLVKILKSNCSKEPACIPHVTLLDPFVEPEHYDEAVEVLRPALDHVQPFTIELSEFGYFSKKKGSILWVKPKSVPSDALASLQKTCQSVFPFCDEITKISPSGFQPHVTLGKFHNKEEAPGKAKQLNEENLPPVRFEVKEINILYRVNGEAAYQVRRTIPLGKAVSPPFFPDVPLPPDL